MKVGVTGGMTESHSVSMPARKIASRPFFERLELRAGKIDSLLCVGLDAHPSLLESPGPEAAIAFCRRMIESTARSACAFKVNSAFFEAMGGEGVHALRTVVASIPDDIPVLLDAKRGDIGSTSEAYVRAVFDVAGADAVTLSAYLGRDALEPFLSRDDRAGFVLVKTSNPGADAIQGLRVKGGEPLYVHLARWVSGWPEADRVGMVVGATDPDAVSRVRQAAPHQWLLCPGVGAQGGDLEATLQAGLREDGMGVLISVSRSLASASSPADEAEALRRRINAVRESAAFGRPEAGGRTGDALARSLVASGCVTFGDFVLKSGKSSPVYIDLRRMASFPELLARAAAAYRPILAELDFDCLAGIPYAGLPIATALSLQTGVPAIYPRKEAKGYGLRAKVEGAYVPGQTAVVIDDVASSGESKLEAIRRLEAEGLRVKDVVVLIDRQGGARSELGSLGYGYHAALKLEDLVAIWRGAGWINDRQVEQVLAGVVD